MARQSDDKVELLLSVTSKSTPSTAQAFFKKLSLCVLQCRFHVDARPKLTEVYCFQKYVYMCRHVLRHILSINYYSLCLHERLSRDTVIDQLSRVIVQSLQSVQVKEGNLFIDRSMCDSAVMEGRPASF